MSSFLFFFLSLKKDTKKEILCVMIPQATKTSLTPFGPNSPTSSLLQTFKLRLRYVAAILNPD
jgi:hypothetical protein